MECKRRAGGCYDTFVPATFPSEGQKALPSWAGEVVVGALRNWGEPSAAMLTLGTYSPQGQSPTVDGGRALPTPNSGFPALGAVYLDLGPSSNQDLKVMLQLANAL